MAQVTNLSQLRAALSASDPNILVAADIVISSQLSVGYAVSIVSDGSASEPYSLSKAADFSGSMFSVSNGELTLKNIVLDGADAGRYTDNVRNRSLIIVSGGTLRLQAGALLQNNSSYQEGGGVYLSGNVSYTNSLIMSDDARITGCESRTSGGGLMAAFRNPGDSVSLSDHVVIDGNTARDGGGVYVRSYVDSVGGSVAIGDYVSISNNSASAAGGGVNVSGFRGGGGALVSLNLSGSASISNNSAVHGGGVYFYGGNIGDIVIVEGSVSLSQNTATGNGGGLNLDFPRTAPMSLNVTGGSVSGNTANTGGGIYMLTQAGGTATMSDASISLNVSNSSGGGLWIQNNSTAVTAVTMLNMTVEGNRAASQGGGVVLNAGPGPCSLGITGGSVSSNTSGANGGGMLIGSAGGCDISVGDCTLADNSADGSGGALYFSNTDSADSVFSMSGTAVTGNKAGYSGGGMSLGSGSGALRSNVYDCNISGNSAGANSGGGIWCGGVNDVLTIGGNTSIDGNSTEYGNGGGIYFNSDSGTLSLTDNTKITNNRADFALSDTGNHGGGISVVPGHVLVGGNTEIAGNSALKYGGGLSASEDSLINMSSGSIHGNSAGMYGGGVYNHAGSEFNLTGGEIYGNSSSVGGAIYNDSVLSVSDAGAIGITALNTAPMAPGIYNGGSFYTVGDRSIDNGLYIVGRDSVARLTGHLSPDFSIQLNGSDYVSPNLEGTPIVVAEGTMGYPFVTEADVAAFKKPVNGFDGWSLRLNDDRTMIVLAPQVFSILYENTEGAFNPNPPSYTVTTEDIYLKDLEPAPGRRFVGWFDALTGGNRVYVIPMGSSGDISLYARWEDALYHWIKYHGNDDINSPALHIPDPVSVEDGGCITISLNIPVRLCFCFTGWNTEANGEGYSYLPGESIMNVSGDIDLYAQWQRCTFCPPRCCCPCMPCPPCSM